MLRQINALGLQKSNLLNWTSSSLLEKLSCLSKNGRQAELLCKYE